MEGIQKTGRGGIAAAVMGKFEQADGNGKRGRCGQKAAHSRRFEIAGQQHAVHPATGEKNQGAVVGRFSPQRRNENRQLPISSSVHDRPARAESDHRYLAAQQDRFQGRVQGVKGDVRPECLHREVGQHIEETFAMVGVIVSEDHRLQPSDAESAEGRGHQPFAHVEGFAREPAAVDQVMAPSGSGKENRVALAHAEGGDRQPRGGIRNEQTNSAGDQQKNQAVAILAVMDGQKQRPSQQADAGNFPRGTVPAPAAQSRQGDDPGDKLQGVADRKAGPSQQKGRYPGAEGKGQNAGEPKRNGQKADGWNRRQIGCEPRRRQQVEVEQDQRKGGEGGRRGGHPEGGDPTGGTGHFCRPSAPAGNQNHDAEHPGKRELEGGLEKSQRLDEQNRKGCGD